LNDLEIRADSFLLEVTVAIVIGQQIGDFREVHDNGFSIFIARAVLVGTSLVTIGKADSTLVAS